MIERLSGAMGGATVGQTSALLDTKPVAVGIFAADGRIVSVNGRAERLCGHFASRLARQLCRRFAAPDDGHRPFLGEDCMAFLRKKGEWAHAPRTVS